MMYGHIISNLQQNELNQKIQTDDLKKNCKKNKKQMRELN